MVAVIGLPPRSSCSQPVPRSLRSRDRYSPRGWSASRTHRPHAALLPPALDNQNQVPSHRASAGHVAIADKSAFERNIDCIMPAQVIGNDRHASRCLESCRRFPSGELSERVAQAIDTVFWQRRSCDLETLVWRLTKAHFALAGRAQQECSHLEDC